LTFIFDVLKKPICDDAYVRAVADTIQREFAYEGLTDIFLKNEWIKMSSIFPGRCCEWFKSYNALVDHMGCRKTIIDALGLRVFQVASKDPVLVGTLGCVWVLVALRITYILSSAFSSLSMALGTGGVITYLCLREGRRSLL
jgi:hypothetical protein